MDVVITSDKKVYASTITTAIEPHKAQSSGISCMSDEMHKLCNSSVALQVALQLNLQHI